MDSARTRRWGWFRYVGRVGGAAALALTLGGFPAAMATTTGQGISAEPVSEDADDSSGEEVATAERPQPADQNVDAETAPTAAAAPAPLVSAAAPSPDMVDGTDVTHVLSGGGVDVTVPEGFPQVLSYQVGGVPFDGQPTLLDTFRINGTDQVADTSLTTATATAAQWTSTLPQMDGLSIESSIAVDGQGRVTFRIDAITGSLEPTVRSIEIPHHSLISVDSTRTGAQLARTAIDSDSTRTADRFIEVTDTAPVDSSPVRSPYAFLSGGAIAAGLWSNATPDRTTGSTHTNARLATQVLDNGQGGRRAELGSGSWVWAPDGATDKRVARYEHPEVTVVLAGDVNGSGVVDWQDAAIGLRDVLPEIPGSDRVPERVAQRIPFNFGSEATNPFLKTLDNTKRIALATDGLGQWVLLKGYTSEGHDSANTDYGGNYNLAAGGLDDLNTLLSAGDDWNADFAVHVNATEAYPQANSFSDDLLTQPEALGWGWLNQSYYIDQRHDLGQGGILDRFQQLYDETGGKLDGVYIDVYYSAGWLPEGLASALHTMGFETASEWSYAFEGDSTWAHWANDKQYGGKTNKGLNSALLRFMANGQRDIWNLDPLLGGTVLLDFEGWTGKDDWNAYAQGIWTDNLPTKYLQHSDLTSWTQGERAVFEGGIEAYLDGDVRVIEQGGVEVARGGTYLLPWGEVGPDGTSSPLTAEKMYLYSPTDITRDFELTAPFAGSTDFVQYKLTDTGRVRVAEVSATDGAVTLTAEANTPYVLVPVGGASALPQNVDWGEGTLVTDPGFNAGDLDAWSPTGAAEAGRTAKGDRTATFGPAASGISQQVTGLVPGEKYSLSVGVEIEPGTTRPTTVSATGAGLDATTTFDATSARNWVGSDSYHGSYLQRAGVQFVAPADGAVRIAVASEAGAGRVTVDNARVQRVRTITEPGNAIDAPAPEVRAADRFWDFEDDLPGYGPFVRGDASGTSDARTSKSRLHAPYSQQGWKNEHAPFNAGALEGLAVDDVLAGTYSLKSHDESNGLIYRTTPATAPFVPGHRYQVGFDYQTSADRSYSWVLGSDDVTTPSSTVLRSTPMNRALETTRHTQEFIASCGADWVGLSKSGGSSGADFVIDNVVVRDLGPTGSTPACSIISGTVEGGELNRGMVNRVTTTVLNAEQKPIQNLGVTLTGVPEGWTVAVEQRDGNLFERVAAGASVTTTWLVVPPAAGAAGPIELGVDATYSIDCVDATAQGWIATSVSARAFVPASRMTATADSEQPGMAGEGDVDYALDGDPGTIWHTSWDERQGFPHWVELDLGDTYTVDGFGYLARQSGGSNGLLKDYALSVSDDGTQWTQVAAGAYSKESADYQVTDLEPVRARYVRLDAKNAHNGLAFAAAAELRVYQTGATVPEAGFAPGERQPTPGGLCAPSATLADVDGGVRPGQVVRFSGERFSSDVDVTVTLHSEPVVVATVRSDVAGSFTGEFTVPADTPAGAHEVELADAAGRTVVLPLTVLTPEDTGGGPGANGAASDGGQGQGTGGVPGHGTDGALAVTGGQDARQ